MNNRSVPSDTVVSHLVYRSLSEACAWLTRVFGFQEHFRYGDPVSGIQMRFGDAVIMLSGSREGRESPAKLGYGTQMLTLIVPDVEPHYTRTKQQGAKIVEELNVTIYGEKQYGVEDLDGHRWLFSQHAHDISPDAWGATIASPLTSAPMSTSTQIFLWHIDYSGWANQELLSACSALTPEELDRDLGASHATILRTLRHIYYAERVWLKRLRADSMPPLREIGNQQLFCDPPPEPTLQQLQSSWPTVSDGLHQYVETLSESELTGDLRGDDFAIPRSKLLLHTVNHSTLHRGQVTSMLRQLGKQPPNTDSFSFHMVRP